MCDFDDKKIILYHSDCFVYIAIVVVILYLLILSLKVKRGDVRQGEEFHMGPPKLSTRRALYEAGQVKIKFPDGVLCV